MRRISSRMRLRAGLVGIGALLVAGCKLAEVTSTEAVDAVVAEGLVQLGLPARAGGASPRTRISVLLHRTVQGAEGLNSPVPGARVDLTLADGSVLRLAERPFFECVESAPLEGTGSCHLADSELYPDPLLARIAPGDLVGLEIETALGEILTSATRIPGGFDFAAAPEGVGPGITNGTACVLAPDTSVPVAWTPAADAWAYVAETLIGGLPAALAAEGIEVDDDPLFLLGLAVSASDTDIVFPLEFGVFDRFDLEADLSLRLQRGLPDGADARVSISAVDRNHVNWIRGGNFNPSGQVRIPSVRGDGTGFFGSSLTRWFDVLTPQAGGVVGLRACPGSTPSS